MAAPAVGGEREKSSGTALEVHMPAVLPLDPHSGATNAARPPDSPSRSGRHGSPALLLAALAWLGAAPRTAAAQVASPDPRAALAAELARYEALAREPGLRPPAARRVVSPGDVHPDAAALRRFLGALGDLPRGSAGVIAPAADTLYTAELVDAVVAFQRRHGLEPDGVIGPATTAQLRVPLARRAHQLALALARWRQLPDTAPGRFIVVNVPAFRLYAFDRDDGSRWPRLRMNVIVGSAEGRHDTPVFSGVLREVVFQPYWDVPPSIARSELLPRIRRDPGYLGREHLEIVRGGDHDAVVHAPTAANLARVATGALRLRQRPGPWNALGAVKFVFPNRYNVYLHGTPAQALFARARRDFSHGCVRVADPTTLAEWVLAGEQGWDRAAVEAAMTSGPPSRRVRLARPLSVHVLYATAVVGDDGLARFYPDIYGHDAVHAEARRDPAR